VSDNPYKELGEFSPFNLFPEMRPGEAFKKITCAGINGREKSAKRDIQEAIYTLNLIINDTLNYHGELIKLSNEDLRAINQRYSEVLDMTPEQTEAARMVLKYCRTNNVGYLKDAVTVLNDLIVKL